jgi:hypothetical protein
MLASTTLQAMVSRRDEIEVVVVPDQGDIAPRLPSILAESWPHRLGGWHQKKARAPGLHSLMSIDGTAERAHRSGPTQRRITTGRVFLIGN